MRKLFVVFLCLFFAFNSYAQPFVDIINLKFSRYPKTVLKNDDRFQSSTNQITGELFVPLQLKSKDVVLLGASYDRLSFDLFKEGVLINNDTDRLHQASLQAGIIKNLNDKWSMTLLAVPKFSECETAFSIRKEYFQMGGAVLFVYKKRNNLKYKFGLYYNREFFGNYFMPLAGIDWKINERTYLFGMLPGSMNLEYLIYKGLYTGLAYKSNTVSYRLNNDRYIREGDKFWGHSMVRNYYQYYFTKQLMVFGEIGYTRFRIFEEYNNQNQPDNTRFVFQKTKDHFYFDAGLAFRVRLDKNYNETVEVK